MSWLDRSVRVRVLRPCTARRRIVVGAMCGALGVFIVVRRMSYIGHGARHSPCSAAWPSARRSALGLYPGASSPRPPLAAGAIDRGLTRAAACTPTPPSGWSTTSVFALGVAIISANRSRDFNVANLLFGNVLGVTDLDLVLAAAIAAGFVLVVVALLQGPGLHHPRPDRRPCPGRPHRLHRAAVHRPRRSCGRDLAPGPRRAAHRCRTHPARRDRSPHQRLLRPRPPHLHRRWERSPASSVSTCSDHLDIASGPAIVLTHTTLFVAVYLGDRLSMGHPYIGAPTCLNRPQRRSSGPPGPMTSLTWRRSTATS